MKEKTDFRVAAIQETPIYLDRDATVNLVAEQVSKAATDGADLVVFPESFVPGYPDWVWRKPLQDHDFYHRFLDQAVDLDSDQLAPVREATKDSGVWVALGLTERSASGTLYNTVAYIDAEGQVADRHRKLKPTSLERTVWGEGQEHLLTVVDINGVRVGSLICWENYMPLARAAMYEAGVDVLLAPTWDNSDEWVSTLRHTAKEGRIYVVGVTACMRGSDVPRDLPGADDIYEGEDDWMSRGNTTIVAPGGHIVDGPLVGEKGVVAADLDIDRVALSRRWFDPVGHYSRPDVLRLTVDKESPDNSLGETK